MPKNTRRVTVTRTVTFTTTIDSPGQPEATDANMLTYLGGAAGTTGTLAIGELLAGSDLANNGIISRGNWSVTGTSVNVEPYTTRPKNTALSVGTRVASIKPPVGKEAALADLFVVTTAGTTANSDAEPSWNTAAYGATTDGTVTYRTIPKFYTPTTFVAATAYAAGTILRPSASSTKEFLVTIATTAATTAPTWTNLDTLGASNSLPGAGAVVCIAGCSTYANRTPYALGEIVKPSAASAEEYIVTTAGRSDTTALTTTVGASVTRGTATFKRLV
jgi:hypothetical protein